MAHDTETAADRERLVEELTWLGYSLGRTDADDFPRVVAFRNALAPESEPLNPDGPEAAKALETLGALRHANYRRRLRMWLEAGVDRGAARPVGLAEADAVAHRLAEVAGDVEAETAHIEKNLEGDLFPFQEEAHKKDLQLAARHRLALQPALERLGGAALAESARYETLARQDIPARRY
jgi:hypothetical protein